MNKYWAIFTKLRMPFMQRLDMTLHHLWEDITGRHAFSGGWYAIDWWGYYKFVEGKEPAAHCYLDDPAWTPKERERLLRAKHYRCPACGNEITEEEWIREQESGSGGYCYCDFTSDGRILHDMEMVVVRPLHRKVRK